MPAKWSRSQYASQTELIPESWPHLLGLIGSISDTLSEATYYAAHTKETTPGQPPRGLQAVQESPDHAAQVLRHDVRMGFISMQPPEPKRRNPHLACSTPPYTAAKLFSFSDKPEYGLGTLWQCKKCRKVWQLVQHSRRQGDSIIHAVWVEVPR